MIKFTCPAADISVSNTNLFMGVGGTRKETHVLARGSLLSPLKMGSFNAGYKPL